jgi:hypothetical protein
MVIDTASPARGRTGEALRIERQAPGTEGPPRSPWRWGAMLLLALLAGLLIVSHGCHGDEDTELFTRGWWSFL